MAEIILYLIRDSSFNNAIAADTAYFDNKAYQDQLRQDMKLTRETPEWMNKGATERNRIWLPKILQKIHEQSCFIAVGLGHLQFKNGLIQLLRQKGYTLEPIELKKYIRH